MRAVAPARRQAREPGVERLADAAADGAETDDADRQWTRARGDSTHRLMRRMVTCAETAE